MLDYIPLYQSSFSSSTFPLFDYWVENYGHAFIYILGALLTFSFIMIIYRVVIETKNWYKNNI